MEMVWTRKGTQGAAKTYMPQTEPCQGRYLEEQCDGRTDVGEPVDLGQRDTKVLLRLSRNCIRASAGSHRGTSRARTRREQQPIHCADASAPLPPSLHLDSRAATILNTTSAAQPANLILYSLYCPSPPPSPSARSLPALLMLRESSSTALSRAVRGNECGREWDMLEWRRYWKGREVSWGRSVGAPTQRSLTPAPPTL